MKPTMRVTIGDMIAAFRRAATSAIDSAGRDIADRSAKSQKTEPVEASDAEQ
ncbi:MAG: hypothetical protein AAFP99_03095 [Pseudomonadota bacterium]